MGGGKGRKKKGPPKDNPKADEETKSDSKADEQKADSKAEDEQKADCKAEEAKKTDTKANVKKKPAKTPTLPDQPTVYPPLASAQEKSAQEKSVVSTSRKKEKPAADPVLPVGAWARGPPSGARSKISEVPTPLTPSVSTTTPSVSTTTLSVSTTTPSVSTTEPIVASSSFDKLRGQGQENFPDLETARQRFPEPKQISEPKSEIEHGRGRGSVRGRDRGPGRGQDFKPASSDVKLSPEPELPIVAAAPIVGPPVTPDATPRPSDQEKRKVKTKYRSKNVTLDLDKSQEIGPKPRAPPPVVSGGVVPPTASLASLAIKEKFRPPNRPGHGTNGYEIQLRANHFPLKIQPGYIQHYDVTIDENKLPTRINREVFKTMVDNDPELKKYFPVYDGKKNMYCIEVLSFGKRQEDYAVSFTENDREKKVLVSIKWAAQISLYEFLDYCIGKRKDYNLATIQALDNVLRYSSTFRYIPVGRNFFLYPGKDIPLGEGRQIWDGRFQSARISQQWKIVLNVDVANTAFYKAQNVIDFTKEFLHNDSFIRDGIQRRDALHLAKEIKNLKVESFHIPGQKRKYTVRAVTPASAREQTFEMEENGRKTNPSVEHYFKQKYNIQLRYPHLPCLHVGNVQRSIFLPMEVCALASGQRCTKKLTDLQTAQMIRTTAKPAYEREREIMKRVQDARFDQDPHLKAFGISIDTRMVEVKGRVLDAPKVQVGEKQVFAPKDGAWDMRNKKLYEGKPVKIWGIACLDQRFRPDDLKNFGMLFSQHSRMVGLVFDPKPVMCLYVNNSGDLENMFNIWKKDHKIQLAIVILPMRSVAYGDVKRAGDIKIGLMTQCVLSKNAQNAKAATIINILLKINAKLGGINHVISGINRPPIFTAEPVIVLGADVTHPSPGDMKPSIAAVVGSLDAHPSRYAAAVRIQTHRKEEIEELTDMVKELLKAFYIATRVKPKKIIFYRDGVSEGQFGIVLQEELTAIQRACRQLEEEYCPGISFVVVQKRHHTRLFCVNQRDQVGRAGNIPAGTIVDHSITHPFEFDFYLCSHYGIQGTSRPTHYHVLWDDNNFSPDELQKLTYQLCHTYVRCTRSVSIPAPAYYAHHVAFRARYHLTERESDSSSVVSGSSANNVVITDEMRSAVKIHESLKTDMYYA